MEWDKKTIAAALVILFGANSTGIINALVPGFRADSFPLSAFQEEKAQIILYTQELHAQDEERMDELRERITRLEEARKECERRIGNCEKHSR